MHSLTSPTATPLGPYIAPFSTTMMMLEELPSCSPSRESEESSFNEISNHSFSSTTTVASVDCSDFPPRLPRRREITFCETLSIREYNVTIGDDRQCSYPLTLTWGSKERCTSLNNHDSKKEERRTKPRRLSTSERKERLRSFGYSQAELNQSQRRRKTRLTMDYAYGYKESSEAAESFEDQQFRYIL